jgi:transposase
MMVNSRMFTMPSALPLRTDFTADDLRRRARRTRDANQARRLLALAAVYEGGSRSDAARIGGVGLQIVRDWVVRFNAHGPDGLIDRQAPGPSPRMSDAQRRALTAMVESGPVPAIHGVVRWRLVDLAQWVWEEFRISVSVQTLSRELRGLGYRKLSARPRHHAQAAGAIEAFKKTSPPLWAKSRARRASSPVR